MKRSGTTRLFYAKRLMQILFAFGLFCAALMITSPVSAQPATAQTALQGATTSMWNLYSPILDSHVVVTSKDSYDFLISVGWQGQGVAYTALSEPGQVDGVPTMPLYRLYSEIIGTHFYATQKWAYDFLVSQGWKGEGIRAYVLTRPTPSVIALERFWHPGKRRHYWSTDPTDRTKLPAQGWDYNGVVGYVLPATFNPANATLPRLQLDSSAALGTAPPATITLSVKSAQSSMIWTKVEYYAINLPGNTKLGETASIATPFTWNAGNIAQGIYDFSAIGTTTNGERITTNTVSISVRPRAAAAPANLPPVINLQSPANGITVSTTSNMIISADVSDSDGVIARVEFFADGQKLGEQNLPPYRFAWQPSVGVHTIMVTATDDTSAKSSTTPVMITASNSVPPPASNQAPTISITAPANNASVTVGTVINIAASAADSDGTVAKVEFFANGNKLGEAAQAPYTYSWANAAAGTYNIAAKATDNLGLAATSAAISVKVNAFVVPPPPPSNPPPTVNLTAPANNASVNVGTAINISATATAADANGTVSKVEFFANGAKLGEDTQTPFTFVWANAAAGAYSITAKATDNADAATTSAAVNIVVVGAVTPPVTGKGTGLLAEYFNNVDLIAPSTVVRVDGNVDFAWLDATIPAPGIGASNFSVRWSGEVIAPVTGGVTFSTSSDDGVRLWINNQQIINNWTGHGATVDTGTPVQMVAGQRYSIRLEYFQGGGGKEIKLRWAHSSNSNTAQAVPMLNLVPATTSNFTLQLALAATSADSFTAPSAIMLMASPTVSGANSPIAKVEFFQSVGAGAIATVIKLGEAVAAPWVYTWANVVEGVYTVAARVTDGNGATGSSLPVSFTVAAAPSAVSAATRDAARLLDQSSFGSTREEIARVASMGLDAYLNEQFRAPQTLHVDTVRNNPLYPTEPYAVMTPSIWKQYFEANDQLRQRVVSALSQILVISQQNNTVGDQACATASYLDMLGRNAFGNFRDILKQATLSPAMGEYLDMKRSAKADTVLKSNPSENYARELMQLFSIGTVMLNTDGSVQFSNGKAVDSYSEASVQEVARALTGWFYAGQDQTKTWRWIYPDVPYPSDAATAAKACTAWSTPMEPWRAAYRSSDNTRDITGSPHDTGAKTLLSYPGSASHKQSLPANQTPEQDLDDVIENVFNHPNVGTFIGELMIQRLTTSNPSGAYVARVVGVFNNNGVGVRGDMKAVVRAILMDAEARAPAVNQAASFGKLREPVLRFTQMHRAFGAKMANGTYQSIYDLSSSDSLSQSPLRAPSVFNFYHPDFSPTGPVSRASLVGPEFEITNSATVAGFMEFSKYAIIGGFGQYEADKNKWLKPNYDYYIGLADTPAAMVDALNLLLLSGSMSPQFRTQLVDTATKLTDSNAITQSSERLRLVLWLILNSPEYAIQK